MELERVESQPKDDGSRRHPAFDHDRCGLGGEY